MKVNPRNERIKRSYFRYLREAKVLEVIEGTSQIQQMVISLHGLRRFGRTA